jgi:hypothetical protein
MSVATRSGLQNRPCPFGERLSDCSPFLVEGSNPQFTKRTKKMNSENIKKVTNQAIEQLITALNEGPKPMNPPTAKGSVLRFYYGPPQAQQEQVKTVSN